MAWCAVSGRCIAGAGQPSCILMGTAWGHPRKRNISHWSVFPDWRCGGWFDAGDFDIQTGSHCNALLSLVAAWEKFKPTVMKPMSIIQHVMLTFTAPMASRIYCSRYNMAH